MIPDEAVEAKCEYCRESIRWDAGRAAWTHADTNLGVFCNPIGHAFESLAALAGG